LVCGLRVVGAVVGYEREPLLDSCSREAGGLH
jgi:hypothetical protein